MFKKGQKIADKTSPHFEYSATVLRMYKNKMLIKDCEGNLFTTDFSKWVAIGIYYRDYYLPRK